MTLKAGYYVGHIQSWELGEANTGNPQFVLRVLLDHFKGPGGKREECDQVERSVYRVITDRTVDYFVNDLKALGYDRDNFDGLDPDSPDAFDFSGLEVEVQLRFETYEGKTREKWNLAVVSGRPEVKPLDVGGRATLNARFGSKLAPLRGGSSPPPIRRRPASSPTVEGPEGLDQESEIPF